MELLIQEVAVGVFFALIQTVLIVQLLILDIKLATLSVVLGLDGLYPVGHLLIELLKGAELEIVLLLHVVVDYSAFVTCLLTFTLGFFFSQLCIEDFLLLRKVCYESLPVGVSEQT